MAASTTNKVALLAAAAKDDINNLTLTSLGGYLAVLANDPGAAKLWSVFTNAGSMMNGSTPVSNVAHVTTATTAAGGTVTINADGTLSYHAPASVTAAQYTAAAAGELVLTDSFSYVAQMANGAMSLANVVFSIRGVNDVAQIGGDDDGSVVEQTQPVDTGVLTIVDPDHDQSAFVATTYSDGYGTLGITAGGAWTFTLQTHSLWGGETATDNVVVKSLDGTQHTVVIHVTGTNDAATFTGADAATITEDTVPAVSGVLVAADLDHDQSTMQASTAAGTYGSLAMNTDGSWSYTIGEAAQALGEGVTKHDIFTVQSFDGTQHQVDITVVGVNDAAVIGDGAGSVVEDTQPSTGGTLTITDVDTGEDHFVASSGNGAYGSLAIAANGDWTYSLGAAAQALWEGEQQTDTFQVSSADGTQATITIQITGTNDAATFSGDDTGAVTEDTSPTATGTLVATDADHDQSSMQASAQDGAYGAFAIDGQGNWSYTLGDAAQALAGGEHQSETFTVLSFDGTAHDIVVGITGTNDPASISGSDTGAVTEDTPPGTAGGQLAVSDADAGEAAFAALGAGALNGTYGTFTFDLGTGDWTYALDNSRAAVQSLNTGDVRLDTLVVHSLDGTATDTISITVNGLNEPAPPVLAQFLINHGKDVSDHNVFTGFGAANTLEYTPNLDYTGATLVDFDHNGTLESTLVSFTFTAGPNVTVVDAVLVGYSAFTAAQLQVVSG
jgi:large repetitive protein